MMDKEQEVIVRAYREKADRGYRVTAALEMEKAPGDFYVTKEDIREMMPKCSRPGTYEDHVDVVSFLRGYKLAANVLTAHAMLLLNGPKGPDDESVMASEVAIARARMCGVRNFLNRLPNEEEKTLLILRYVLCFTFEQCADSLHVSRATVYRMHARAIRNAEIAYLE